MRPRVLVGERLRAILRWVQNPVWVVFSCRSERPDGISR